LPVDHDFPYDKYSIDSIVEFAQRLVGRTLREFVPVDSIANPRRRKGSFGNAVEELYFLLTINSDPRPDFHEVNLELKSTPLKHVRGGEIVAKERLVITMVSYPEVVRETFETSHLVEKASDMLLISYLWEEGRDPLDYVIEYAGRWGLPEEDMPQFKADWETVVAKVRAGHAEDISSSDTLYLEACTKSADSSRRTPQPFSDVPAKPRAWALKASYMTAISGGLLASMKPIRRAADERGLDLLGLVRRRFEPPTSGGPRRSSPQRRATPGPTGTHPRQSPRSSPSEYSAWTRSPGSQSSRRLASSPRPSGSRGTASPRRPCRSRHSTTSGS
jgi:DNA mismatch repair protein MutH